MFRLFWPKCGLQAPSAAWITSRRQASLTAIETPRYAGNDHCAVDRERQSVKASPDQDRQPDRHHAGEKDRADRVVQQCGIHESPCAYSHLNTREFAHESGRAFPRLRSIWKDECSQCAWVCAFASVQLGIGSESGHVTRPSTACLPPRKMWMQGARARQATPLFERFGRT